VICFLAVVLMAGCAAQENRGDSSKGYFVRDAAGTWYEASYSLVLVFDSDSILENQSLLRAH